LSLPAADDRRRVKSTAGTVKVSISDGKKMMRNIFEFGEHLDGFALRVLNERAVRAGAGLAFLLAT
jgi:hypothetical protein